MIKIETDLVCCNEWMMRILNFSWNDHPHDCVKKLHIKFNMLIKLSMNETINMD